MIPEYEAIHGGPFTYDDHGQTFTLRAGDGWALHMGNPEDVQKEDPRLVQRGIVAAMLIYIGKANGINLCMGKEDGIREGDAIDGDVSLDIERDVMQLIDRVKK